MAIVEVARGPNGQDWGLLPKSAYCTAEGSSATDSLSEDVISIPVALLIIVDCGLWTVDCGLMTND